jgi:hypothetical protein
MAGCHATLESQQQIAEVDWLRAPMMLAPCGCFLAQAGGRGKVGTHHFWPIWAAC